MHVDLKYTKIAEELARTGLSVTPHFIDSDFLAEMRADLHRLQAAGEFKPAGIGKGSTQQVQNSIRQNELCWLDRQHSNATQTQLWQELDLLQQAINRTLFLGLREFEGHYTHYAAGGFYQRHLDAFSRDQARTVSLILYLNQDWVPAHGGELRLYHGDSHTDVAPVGGTLACFLSRDLEHEVCLNHADRFSFTGWYKN